MKEKEAERLDIEEKYSSLQEEVAGKTRKLKKVWSMYSTAKGNKCALYIEYLGGKKYYVMEKVLIKKRP